MPGPSLQLCTTLQAIPESDQAKESTEVLSRLPCIPASPSAQSCFFLFFFFSISIIRKNNL